MDLSKAFNKKSSVRGRYLLQRPLWQYYLIVGISWAMVVGTLEIASLFVFGSLELTRMEIATHYGVQFLAGSLFALIMRSQWKYEIELDERESNRAYDSKEARKDDKQ